MSDPPRPLELALVGIVAHSESFSLLQELLPTIDIYDAVHS